MAVEVMRNVEFNEGNGRHSRFTISSENGKHIGEMDVAVSSGRVTVYHTGVVKEEEGKGYAKTMFEALLAFARKQKLRIVPTCRFVRAQLERDPEQYKDVYGTEN